MGQADPASFSSELYSAYAAGRLDPALVLLMETQAALRPLSADPLTRSDVLGGALLEREERSQLSTGALGRALEAIETVEQDHDPRPESRAASVASSTLGEIALLPVLLHDYIFDAMAGEGWRGAGRGLKILRLEAGGEAECELLRIEPGCGAPRHSHRGQEFTLVLTGSFNDGRGQYKVGDLSIAGPEDTHRPIADEGEICYALAVRDGGLAFTGVLGMIQRVLGK